MGSVGTEVITIDLNGHTLTFNQTNSDWNNINTNGAKLVIKNGNITNAGHNDGPWNRHDLNFVCPVELVNVVSDKAIALAKDATLTEVTINDANTSDTYAVWVRPMGQTVVLDECTIDMLNCSDGRGLKIDNQYLSAAEEAKVTLKVSNTVFKTEEKSAILVKTTAGAAITLNNVDITEVKADNVNHVWVDSDTAAYADKVIVTGGKVIVE
jgi:S1-C subfamily serine protease